MRGTGPEVYRGLAGMLLIGDEVSESLALPSDHGVDDLPLILQGRRFDHNNQLGYLSDHPHIMIGDTMLVNGTVNPMFRAQHQRLRRRLPMLPTRVSLRWPSVRGVRSGLWPVKADFWNGHRVWSSWR